MDVGVICQICGEGEATSFRKAEPIEYKGKSGQVELHMNQCSFCGAETIDEGQSMLNRREVVRFKKRVDKVPLGEDVKKMRKSIGLTQVEAGAIFGGGPVAFSKYENDDLMPDEAMSNLLRLAIDDASIVEKMRSLKSALFDSSIVVQLPVYRSIDNSMSDSTAWSNDSELFEGIDDLPLATNFVSKHFAFSFEKNRESEWKKLH
jgi:putative zinc finger/helix-turn-helix YgiT family protein